MQKHMRHVTVLAAFLCAAFYISPFSAGVQSVSPPPKLAPEIPPNITNPDSVERSPGTLKCFDGLPHQETVGKVCDNSKAPQ